jgi:2-polyprenyl-6-hydroxyphenyl methylase / 3-demethylubiquinone-9 3-methyltransferase
MSSKINNRWYDDLGGAWWDRRGPVGLLHDLKPALFAYFKGAVGESEELKILDVGCGGGLLSEMFAAEAARVTGVDLSHNSLVAAAQHARASGLAIDYATSRGESLPFLDSAFDVVVAADFLEHVSNLDAVIGECARMLKPSGLFLYDTINRTLRSRVVAVWMFERALKIIPKNTHDPRLFIKPEELHETMARHGLINCETRGLAPAHGKLSALISLINTGRAGPFRTGDDRAISYVGYSRKSR